MTPVLSATASEPSPLPSLPSSPIEEDVTGSYAHDSITPQAKSTPYDGKGKGRLTESPTPYTDDGLEEASNSDEGEQPRPEEEADSRRIAENLRRWEVAERQRRRAARESASVSIVGHVSRRASYLWSGRSSQRPPSGVGSHRALRTQESEDGVPLEELDPSPIHSPDPRASLQDPENPFEDPAHVRSVSTSSLNTPDCSAVMSESSGAPPGPHASSSFPPNSNSKRPHPPPQPLDLPRPRTPPPRAETPHTSKPPESIPPISSTIPRNEGDILDEERETRWWTDWLCGCHEGPDRGGDNQAGRTNPFA